MSDQLRWDGAVLRGPIQPDPLLKSIPSGPSWLAPFNTGPWSVGMSNAPGHCFNLECDVKPVFPANAFCQVRVMNHHDPGAQPPIVFELKPSDFNERNVGLYCLDEGYKSDLAARSTFELVVRRTESPAFACEADAHMAARYLHGEARIPAPNLPLSRANFEPINVPDFIHSPLPFDVRFTFPRSGKDLWANSTILKQTSPYFKTQLESGFAESEAKSVTYPGETVDLVIETDADSTDSETETETRVAAPTKPETRVYTIKVTRHAFTTYEATWLWILTKKVAFAPLRSSLAPVDSDSTAPAAPAEEHATKSPSAPVVGAPVSPKSIYRLAHLLELTTLRLEALKAYKTSLTVENIAQELFSCTADTYEEIRTVAAEFAVSHRNEVGKTAQMEAQLAQVSAREVDHGGVISVALARAALAKVV